MFLFQIQKPKVEQNQQQYQLFSSGISNGLPATLQKQFESWGGKNREDARNFCEAVGQFTTVSLSPDELKNMK